jgi:cytochrome c oxidase subunit 2
VFNNWFPESISLVARKIDALFWLATAWTGATGIIVLLILGSFLILYRQRQGRHAFYTHGNSKGALVLTLVLAFLVFVALDLNLAYHDHRVWKAMFGHPPTVEEALRVEVMPEQFVWNIRYAGVDEKFGTDDDIVTMNELHVPVGKPVLVQLTPKDVVHSFFLPNLRIKQDAIPGMITTIYFTPESEGNFNIACAQHCGLGHYRMKGTFVVQPLSDFHAWLSEQPRQDGDSAWGWDWTRGLAGGGGPRRKKEI